MVNYNLVDKEGNKGFGLEYVGYVELGDIASSERFKSQLNIELTHGYPTFLEILDYWRTKEKVGEWDTTLSYQKIVYQ